MPVSDKEARMRPPEELYTIHHDVTFVERPVLVCAFSGFVDAGSAVRLAAEHLLSQHEHRLIATFDLDEMLDYRARRPRMRFVVDRFASVDMPQIGLHEVVDANGTPFLLLAGPEPDYQWQRFVEAVDQLVRHFDVRLVVSLTAVPWPAPHTRPIGLTMHGSDPDLLQGFTSPLGEIEVPGHVGALLEMQLGERGTPSMGITAQVPHYLVQFEYPGATAALLAGLSGLAGFALPDDALRPAATSAEQEIAGQLAGNDEFATVVAALEQQYDILSGQAGGEGLADLAPGGGIPSGEEIAAQFEEFLRGVDDPPDKTEG